MKENLNDENESNEQNNEEGNYKIPNFVRILEYKIEKYNAKIEEELNNIDKIKNQLEYLNNLGNIKENEKYKELEEYVSGIEKRVKENIKI